MTTNTEAAIGWMAERQGKVTYSMAYRDGPNSYDCSSAIYYALMSAGAVSAGWAVNTEYMHDWLIKNGYELIAENQDWNAQRGDIAIWGQRGQSAGAGGHIVMFIDPENIIHCNYANNGITVNNYNQTAEAAGWMYCYVYRLKTQAQPESGKIEKTNKISEENEMFIATAKNRGIALMQGGHFLPFYDAKDPISFMAQGVPVMEVATITFDKWQAQSGASAYDDDMVAKMNEILKEIRK